MAKTVVVQTVLAAFVACSVLVAPASCGVVSLADVTGTTPRPQFVEPNGVSFVGYPEAPAPARRPGVVSLSDVTGLTPGQHAALGGGAYTGPQHAGRPGAVSLTDVAGVAPRPPRPAQGGVVSLTDVTGLAPEYLAQPAHPRPLHLEQGYDPQRPYSPCYVPGAAVPAYTAPAYTAPAYTPPAYTPPAYTAPAYTAPQHPAHLGGVRLARSKRSPRPGPQHGSVRLEDVAGPGAGRYPSFGPPAYVSPYRPSYPYYNNYYYNRPYYNRPYYGMPVACFGLLCL